MNVGWNWEVRERLGRVTARNLDLKKAQITISVIQSVLISAKVWGQSFEIQPNNYSGLLRNLNMGTSDPVITQNARKGLRPYLHPIKTPDGKSVLTESAFVQFSYAVCGYSSVGAGGSSCTSLNEP